MARSFASPLMIVILLASACATTSDESPPVLVRVQSLEGGAMIRFPGRPDAVEPADLSLAGILDARFIEADRQGRSPIEMRFRLDSPFVGDIDLRFEPDGWYVPGELGLKRALAFELGEIFRDPEMVSGQSGALELAAGQFPLLRAIAALLQSDLNDREVFVCGHLHRQSTAGELSLARARAVADFLVAHGVDRRRIEVAGFGGRFPAADGDSVLAKRRNQRTDILVRW